MFAETSQRTFPLHLDDIRCNIIEEGWVVRYHHHRNQPIGRGGEVVLEPLDSMDYGTWLEGVSAIELLSALNTKNMLTLFKQKLLRAPKKSKTITRISTNPHNSQKEEVTNTSKDHSRGRPHVPSKWLVGSSSSRSSALARDARASDTRIAHPPLSDLTGVSNN